MLLSRGEHPPDLHLVLVVEPLEELIEVADLNLDPLLQLSIVHVQVADHGIHDDVVLQQGRGKGWRMTESTTSSSSCKGMSFGGSVQVMQQVTRSTIVTYGRCEMTNTEKSSSRWDYEGGIHTGPRGTRYIPKHSSDAGIRVYASQNAAGSIHASPPDCPVANPSRSPGHASPTARLTDPDANPSRTVSTMR